MSRTPLLHTLSGKYLVEGYAHALAPDTLATLVGTGDIEAPWVASAVVAAAQNYAHSYTLAPSGQIYRDGLAWLDVADLFAWHGPSDVTVASSVAAPYIAPAAVLSAAGATYGAFDRIQDLTTNARILITGSLAGGVVGRTMSGGVAAPIPAGRLVRLLRGPASATAVTRLLAWKTGLVIVAAVGGCGVNQVMYVAVINEAGNASVSQIDPPLTQTSINVRSMTATITGDTWADILWENASTRDVRHVRVDLVTVTAIDMGPLYASPMGTLPGLTAQSLHGWCPTAASVTASAPSDGSIRLRAQGPVGSLATATVRRGPTVVASLLSARAEPQGYEHAIPYSGPLEAAYLVIVPDLPSDSTLAVPAAHTAGGIKYPVTVVRGNGRSTQTFPSACSDDTGCLPAVAGRLWAPSDVVEVSYLPTCPSPSSASLDVFAFDRDGGLVYASRAVRTTQATIVATVTGADLAPIACPSLSPCGCPMSPVPPWNGSTSTYDLVALTVANITLLESAGPAVISITRTDGGPPLPVRVRTVNGTATAGADYTAVDTIVSLPGSGTVTVPVTVANRGGLQGDRAFTVIVEQPPCQA